MHRFRHPAQESAALCTALVLTLVSAGACQNAPASPTGAIESQAAPVSALVTIAESSTLEQVAAGQTATSNNYLGQSVTIPGTSSYNNLRFNWDGYGPGTVSAPGPRGPLAVGDLFVLTEEYLGLAGDLGTSTPGFVARSQTIDNGQYVFSPSATLKGGAKYWFYSSWVPGVVQSFNPITGFAEDTYVGGDMYIAPVLSGTFTPIPFRKAQASWRLISPGPPAQYYVPPPGTYIDANFKLMGVPINR